jgi:phage protein|nr:MAG TPA: Protein of unknown function (DUF1642) [Caudoviricetes sp.]
MNKKELIERIEGLKNLFGNKAEYIEIDAAIELISKLDEPETGHADEAPRYVKNILARLRELPVHDREVWLKAIMGEFEQDFSHAKWREGYEQGKFEGAWVGNQLKDADKIRQELNKVALPNFMDDWIFKCQLLNDFSLSDALNSKIINLYAKNGEVVMKWLKDKKNQELFARAWIDDYEPEKESKYRVKLKNTNDYLNETEIGFHFYNNEKNNKTFTRKELEYSDFGWVLDCPGIDLEEVE